MADVTRFPRNFIAYPTSDAAQTDVNGIQPGGDTNVSGAIAPSSARSEWPTGVAPQAAPSNPYAALTGPAPLPASGATGVDYKQNLASAKKKSSTALTV